MDAYAIYLTIILINNSIIRTHVAYFDTLIQCEKALNSEQYTIYLERRYIGIGTKSKNSICKKVESI